MHGTSGYFSTLINGLGTASQPFSLLSSSAMNVSFPSLPITDLERNPTGTFRSLSRVTRMPHWHNALLIPLRMDLLPSPYSQASRETRLSILYSHTFYFSAVCVLLFASSLLSSPASRKLSVTHWCPSSHVVCFFLLPSPHISWFSSQWSRHPVSSSFGGSTWSAIP